jgi:hypothetical protein
MSCLSAVQRNDAQFTIGLPSKLTMRFVAQLYGEGVATFVLMPYLIRAKCSFYAKVDI